mgnify:CR=1 FL=1
MHTLTAYLATLALLAWSGISFCQTDLAYREGVRLFSTRDFEGALQRFDQSLRNNPDNTLARYYLGMCRYNLKQYDDALSDLSRFLDDGWSAQRQNQFLNAVNTVASIWRERKAPEETVAFCQRILSKIPIQPETDGIRRTVENYLVNASTQLASAASSAGDHSAAATYYETALAVRGQDSNLWMRLADSLLLSGAVSRARAAAVKAASVLNPESSWQAKLAPLVTFAKCAQSPDDWNTLQDASVTDTFVRQAAVFLREVWRDDYRAAFQIAAPLEKQMNTAGEFSHTVALRISPIRPLKPDYQLIFLSTFPSDAYLDWAVDTYISKTPAERRDEAREALVSVLKEIVAKSGNTRASQKAYQRLIDVSFIGIPDTDEAAKEKIALCVDFRKRYPDSEFLPSVLLTEAYLRVHRFGEYREGIEIYSRLSAREKSHLSSLALCYGKIGDYARAISIQSEYLASFPNDHAGILQLVQYQIEAGMIAEAMRTSEDLRKRQGVSQYIKDRLTELTSGVRRVLPEGTVPPESIPAIVVECRREITYSTSAVSVEPGGNLLFQENRSVELYAFSSQRKSMTVSLSAFSDIFPAVTDPPTMTEKSGSVWVNRLQRSLVSSPDIWRRSEPWRFSFPYSMRASEAITVQRSFSASSDNTGTVQIIVEVPSSGWNLDISFSGRVSKISTAFPPPSESGQRSVAYAGLPAGRTEIRLTFPSPQSYLCYPRVRLFRSDAQTVSVQTQGRQTTIQPDSGMRLTFTAQERFTIARCLSVMETAYVLDERFDER